MYQQANKLLPQSTAIESFREGLSHDALPPLGCVRPANTSATYYKLLADRICSNFRGVQELLDNARNSGSGWNASQVHIWLDDDGTLTVQDNGRGMSYSELSAACNFGHSDQIQRPDDPVYSRYGDGMKAAYARLSDLTFLFSKHRGANGQLAQTVSLFGAGLGMSEYVYGLLPIPVGLQGSSWKDLLPDDAQVSPDKAVHAPQAPCHERPQPPTEAGPEPAVRPRRSCGGSKASGGAALGSHDGAECRERRGATAAGPKDRDGRQHRHGGLAAAAWRGHAGWRRCARPRRRRSAVHHKRRQPSSC